MDKFEKTVNEIRKFNRFYTVNMGFLNLDYLNMEYSIVETRILFEIKMNGTCIQNEIAKTLHIDKSYLSRIIKRFYKGGLVEKDKSKEDKRATFITLTEKGNTETEKLIELTNHQIRDQISKLDSDECDKLCNAMNTVISILGKGEKNEDYTI